MVVTDSEVIDKLIFSGDIQLSLLGSLAGISRKLAFQVKLYKEAVERNENQEIKDSIIAEIDRLNNRICGLRESLQPGS